MNELRGYAALIATILETTDPAMLALVEELMRLDQGGSLDHLEPDLFGVAALEARGDVRTMKAAGTLNQFCKAHDLKVPVIDEITEDQRIIGLAADLIASVSPATLKRVMSGSYTSNPTVSSRRFAELVKAIDARYANLIEATYRDYGKER